MPASAMRSAVGPEPRSKADPMAVGAVAALVALGDGRRVVPALLSSVAARRLLSLPACLSAFAVWLEMCVEPALVVPPLFVPLVGLLPLPVWMHSL